MSNGWVAALVFLTGTVVVGDAVAQETGPGLVIPVPAPSRIVPVADTFVAPGGGLRVLEIFRPLSSAGPVPIVLFANGSGAGLPRMRGYRDWARLVADRGMAGVLYEGPAFDPAKSLADHLGASVAHLDLVIAVLRRRGAALGVDPTRVVVWAGSAQTATGTPFALGGDRPVVGYVLYYGSGQVP